MSFDYGQFESFDPYDYDNEEEEKECLILELKELDRLLWHYNSPKRMIKMVAKMEEQKMHLEEELLKLI